MDILKTTDQKKKHQMKVYLNTLIENLDNVIDLNIYHLMNYELNI